MPQEFTVVVSQMSSHSEASGALVRAPKPPIFGTPTFSVGPTSLIRPISIGNVANRPTFGRIENSASSTLTGALSLPRDTKVIVTVTSDEEPFTRLRKSAEEMIRSQITSGMERDMSVRIYDELSLLFNSILYLYHAH